MPEREELVRNDEVSMLRAFVLRTNGLDTDKVPCFVERAWFIADVSAFALSSVADARGDSAADRLAWVTSPAVSIEISREDEMASGDKTVNWSAFPETELVVAYPVRVVDKPVVLTRSLVSRVS